MRHIKITIATACLALAATITPAAQATETEPPGSVESSLDMLSVAALPIFTPFIAYAMCASGSSHGKEILPGQCLREALSY